MLIQLPPSDEGGGFCVSKTRRERNTTSKPHYYLSLPQSKSQAISTAPSSEGAEHNGKKTDRLTINYNLKSSAEAELNDNYVLIVQLI